MPPKRKVEKYILVALHLTNTAGLSMGFAVNRALDIVGNTILILLLLFVCGWMWPTYQKIQRYAAVGHPNAAPAKIMFWFAVAAMPFWMVRVAYGLVVPITQNPALDGILGNFDVKFLILFWMYIISMILLLIGGWFSIGWQREVGTTVEYLGDQDETTWDRERRRTVNRGRRKIMYGDGDPAPDGVDPRSSMTEVVVRPKPSHASSMSMYTTRNSLDTRSSSRPLQPKPSQASSTMYTTTRHSLDTSTSSTRPLRPRPSHASSTFGEGAHVRTSSSSSRPLRARPSHASSTLVESYPRTSSSARAPRWPHEADRIYVEPDALQRWPWRP